MSDASEQLAAIKAGNKIQEPVGKLEKTKVEQLAEIELEIKKLELETKKLEILEKSANLTDIKERLAERELKREARRQTSFTNGETLKSLGLSDIQTQKRCNHRKGGDGLQGIVGGRGTDSQYAIMVHTFCHGDTWIRCLRCGKSWKPPLLKTYQTAGRSELKAQELYVAAAAEYQAALNFQTNNKPSSSVVFNFSDHGNDMRNRLEPTNLR